MQNSLFGEIKENYELFDANRLHIILRREMTAEEAEKSNEHFIKSLCPNLKFRKASESKVRVYRINK